MIVSMANSLTITKYQYNVQNMKKWLTSSQQPNLDMIFKISSNDADNENNGPEIPKY